MGRFIRNVLLFFFVVIVVIGIFFGTRGCGIADKYGIDIPQFNQQTKFLGPILAQKSGKLIFHSGKNIWQQINQQSENWREDLSNMLTDKVINAVDSMIYLDENSIEYIKSIVDSTIRENIQDVDLQKIEDGTYDLTIDLTKFFQTQAQKLKEGLSDELDSLIKEIPRKPLKPSGNY